MLTVAVFSDTHGSNALMLEAVRRERPDLLIHLGDFSRDAELLRREFPEIPLYSVCGNCDAAPSAPLTLTVELGPVKAFLTHGHRYSVDWRLDSLVYAAQEAGAHLALFGHTHEALNTDWGGVQLINPGTAGKGRKLTMAWLTIYDNGGVAAEIRPLDRSQG